MYHLELREPPHTVHAFNLTPERLDNEVVKPLLGGQLFNFADNEWLPQHATVTILEGPELPLSELGLGRGWTNATRRGENVTAKVLEAARAAQPPDGTALPAVAGIGRDILARCTAEPVTLRVVWRLVEATAPDASAGEGLMLAERALTPLLRDGLIEIYRGNAPDAAPLAPEDATRVLRAVDEWSNETSDAVFVRAVAGNAATPAGSS